MDKALQSKRRMISLAVCILPFFGHPVKNAFADESVVLVSKIFPAGGKEKDVEERLRKVVDYIKNKEPNITYRLHRTDKPVTTFMFYEVYPSQAAFEEHKKDLAAFRATYEPAPNDFFAKPPDTDFYQIIVE